MQASARKDQFAESSGPVSISRRDVPELGCGVEDLEVTTDMSASCNRQELRGSGVPGELVGLPSMASLAWLFGFGQLQLRERYVVGTFVLKKSVRSPG